MNPAVPAAHAGGLPGRGQRGPTPPRASGAPRAPGPSSNAGRPPAQGLSTCQQIRAALYLECSAKFRENVEDVFREAAKVALSSLKKARRQKHQRRCLLL